MRLIYPGPYTSVRVPAAGWVECPAGQPVDIPDDIAESLIAQGWQQSEGEADNEQPNNTDEE